MNPTLLFDVLEAAPAIVTDVEAVIAQVKGDSNLAAKVQGAIAGIEKLATDLLPALKAL